jgi:hypothetical protein
MKWFYDLEFLTATQWWITALLILLTSALAGTQYCISRLQKIEEQKTKRQVGSLEAKTNDLKDYSEIAKLNAIGLPGDGLEVLFTSPLHELLKGQVSGLASEYKYATTPQAQEAYKRVTEAYPTYPWGWFLYAVCLRHRGDGNWKRYAERAKSIVEKTTAIPGHHLSHDLLRHQVQVIIEAKDWPPRDAPGFNSEPTRQP